MAKHVSCMHALLSMSFETWLLYNFNGSIKYRLRKAKVWTSHNRLSPDLEVCNQKVVINHNHQFYLHMMGSKYYSLYQSLPCMAYMYQPQSENLMVTVLIKHTRMPHIMASLSTSPYAFKKGLAKCLCTIHPEFHVFKH